MQKRTDNAQAIGLALSGGGSRAAVFHLGVLRQMAEQNLLERVHYLSTVSGGSLLAGLVMHHSGHVWPSSSEFMRFVYPAVKRVLCGTDLQRAYLLELVKPNNWNNWSSRANLLAKCIVNQWGIKVQLGELTGFPGWEINTTSMQYGERWVFRIDGQRARPCEQGGPGNKRDAKSVWLADALAASAAFPGFCSPLEQPPLPSQATPDLDHGWTPPRWHKKTPVHQLADGGVYDNLGLEALFDVGKHEIKPNCHCDFVLVSDAGAPLQRKHWGRRSQFVGMTPRTVDIMSNQSRNLRVRSFAGFLRADATQGALVTIGAAAEGLLPTYDRGVWPEGHPATVPTSLHPLGEAEFAAVEAHGFARTEQELLLPATYG